MVSCTLEKPLLVRNNCAKYFQTFCSVEFKMKCFSVRLITTSILYLNYNVCRLTEG